MFILFLLTLLAICKIEMTHCHFKVMSPEMRFISILQIDFEIDFGFGYVNQTVLISKSQTVFDFGFDSEFKIKSKSKTN